MLQNLLRTAVLAAAGLVVASSTSLASPISFSALASGASMEGVGTVDPRLTIATTNGMGQVIRQGSANVRYNWNGAASQDNGGIIPSGGFADMDPGLTRHDFVFVPNGGLLITSFSVRMLDFGDYNPYSGTASAARVVGLDASSTVVASDTISFTHDATANPTVGSLGNPQVTSDATAAPGSPGNYTFNISAPNIARVEFQFLHNSAQVLTTIPSDPNIGFDSLDVTFTPEPAGATVIVFAAAAALLRRRLRSGCER